MSLSRIISAVTDARRAALIRIIIGADAILRGIEARRVMLAVTEPGRLQLPHFDWFRVPPQPWVDIYTGTWIALAIAFAIGWRARVTGLALAGLIFASLFLDQQTFSNHLYFIAIIVFLLALAGAGARYSIDARMGRGSAVVAQWPLTLLKIQLSLLYFFGSISKINSVYLSGMVLYLNLESGGLIVLPPEMRGIEICKALSIFSVVADLALAIGLWLPRFRTITAVAGIGFHLFMVALLTADLSGQLTMFAVACIALYLLFFPDAPRVQEEAAER